MADHKFRKGRNHILRSFLIEWIFLNVDVGLNFWFLKHPETVEFEDNVMGLFLLNVDAFLFGVDAEHEIVCKNCVTFLEVLNLFVKLILIVQVGEYFYGLFFLLSKIIVSWKQDDHIDHKYFDGNFGNPRVLKQIADNIIEAMR